MKLFLSYNLIDETNFEIEYVVICSITPGFGDTQATAAFNMPLSSGY